MKKRLSYFELLLTGLGLISLNSLPAQGWQDVFALANENNESINVLLNGESEFFFGGTFQEVLQLGEVLLQSSGEEDVFLARRSEGGALKVLFSGGSVEQDELYDAAYNGQDQLYVCGSFWLNGRFNGVDLTSTGNPKGIYLMKIDTVGSVSWYQVITGSNLKEVGQLALDEQENVYLGGFFSDTLLVGDTVLLAEGSTAAFLASFDPSGIFRWALTFGGTRDNRITQVVAGPDHQIAVTGFYDDTLAIADTLLPANTADRDVFVAVFDTDGRFQWVRKAGGVFEEEPRAIDVDEAGNIYTTGQLVGVMKLNDTVSIQSRDGNADCYLLKYAPDGDLVWAKVIGGDRLQFVDDLKIRDSKLFLCGAFQDNLQADQLQLTATSAFDGYLLELDLDGNAIQLSGLPGSGFVLPRRVCPRANNTVLIAGEFNESLQLGEETLQAQSSSFDLFFGTFNPLLTSVFSNKYLPVIRMYPNPVRDWLQLELPADAGGLDLFDINGRLVRSYGAPVERIWVGDLEPGVYNLVVYGAGWRAALKVVRYR